MRPWVAAMGVAVWAALAAPAPAAPRCEGAASRDAARPCDNPALRHRVRPGPDRARLIPNPACDSVEREPVEACVYGAAQPVATVALLGDSHAQHWRAGVDAMGEQLGWQVRELAQPHCAFTAAEPDSGAYFNKLCTDLNRDIVPYLADRPEIRTVLVSAHTHQAIKVPPGQDEFETRVQGYVDAWATLPASVTDVVVLRDVPRDSVRSFDCVRRAIRRGRDAGRRCRITRAQGMAPDPEVVAARRASGRRVTVLDQTAQFCSARWCFPVVGGVLTHKDTQHLGAPFARTLGPILARKVNDSGIGEGQDR